MPRSKNTEKEDCSVSIFGRNVSICVDLQVECLVEEREECPPLGLRPELGTVWKLGRGNNPEKEQNHTFHSLFLFLAHYCLLSDLRDTYGSHCPAFEAACS